MHRQQKHMNFKQSPQVHRIKNFTYMQQNMIGKGAAGKVYKGINEQTGQQVAIKIMQMSEIDNEVTQYLLQCQKQSLTSINNEYVLRAYEILQTQQQCLIITPLCNGGTLKQYIKSKCKLVEPEALHIFAKLLRGYLAIRDKGFIHRDLKSSNIMFRNGEPVIIDFGYCEKMKGKKPKIFYNVGSPSYMSPQAYYKTMYSEKSDLWALGIILYQMLEGYTIDHGQPIDRYFASLTKNGVAFRAKISEETKKLVKFILSPNPHTRPSIDQVIQIVERLMFQGNQMQGMNSKGNQHQQRHQQAYQNGKISLKQSRKNHVLSQKLIPSRENMPGPQLQSQPHIQVQQMVHQQKKVSVNNQVLVHSSPLIMFQQPVQGFDKKMVKMSESVYRPQSQAHQHIAQRPQSTKTMPEGQPQMVVNMVPQQIPIFMQQQQAPQFQQQILQQQQQQQQIMLFDNRQLQQLQQSQQAQQAQQTQPQIQINQISPQQQVQLIAQQQQHGHGKKQSNHMLQKLNPSRMGQVYQSLIQNPTHNHNQHQLSIMQNNKNLRVCHSKIFNDGHSVLTIQHNDTNHDWQMNNQQQMNSQQINNQQQQQQQILVQQRNMLLNALMTNSIHQNDFNINIRQSIGSTTSSLSGQSVQSSIQQNNKHNYIQNMILLSSVPTSTRLHNPVVQSVIVQPSPRMSVQAYHNANHNNMHVNSNSNGNQLGHDSRGQVYRSMMVGQTHQQFYPLPQHQQQQQQYQFMNQQHQQPSQQQMAYIHNHIPQYQPQQAQQPQQQQFQHIPMTSSIPAYNPVHAQQQPVYANNNQFKEPSPRRYFNTEVDLYPMHMHNIGPAGGNKYHPLKPNSRPLSPVAVERASMPINHTNANNNINSNNTNINNNNTHQQLQLQLQQVPFFVQRPLANNTNINIERNFLKKTQPYFHMSNNKQNFMIPTNQKPNQQHKQTKNNQRPISEYPKSSTQVQSQPVFKGHHQQQFCRPIQVQGQKQRVNVNQKLAPPVYF